MIKIVLGLVILIVNHQYVHIYNQPKLAIALLLIGIFVTLWGFFYIVMWSIGRLVGKNTNTFEQISYTVAIMSAVFVCMHVTFMILENRNLLLGGVFTACFAIIILIVIYSKRTHQTH